MFKQPPSRRQLLAAGACLPLLMSLPPAQAQQALRAVGVFALLGDVLQVVQPADVTDTRIERSSREDLIVADIGLDQAALRAAHEALGRHSPKAQRLMYRAPTALSVDQQREIAAGAQRAELPGWIVGAIQSAQLSHVLLITRNRGDARFPVEDGHSVGRGTVEGIGFYLDKTTEVKNASTGHLSRGFLGPFVQTRLQLMEVASGNVIAQEDLRASRMAAGRRDEDVSNAWNALGPREKVDTLREMVQQNVARLMPQLLAKV